MDATVELTPTAALPPDPLTLPAPAQDLAWRIKELTRGIAQMERSADHHQADADAGGSTLSDGSQIPADICQRCADTSRYLAYELRLALARLDFSRYLGL